ncbi:hypothetical protein [Paenibacillus chungangensis]|uniref:Uncharacterized protein n=1 Tax=Paenibacillus chungangensis TaxID=696535 RepID=A0ABW3HL25_9BACL
MRMKLLQLAFFVVITVFFDKRGLLKYARKRIFGLIHSAYFFSHILSALTNCPSL